MQIVYVTNEYIDPITLKVFDGGLANYLYKITNSLANLGHKITVIVANSCIDKELEYKGVYIIWVSNILKKTFLQKIFFLFATKKIRTQIRNKIIWKKINKKILELDKKNLIDIIQYTNCLAQYTGNYLKNVPYCIRISSYAKLWQKYYNYDNPEEIKNETSQFKNAKFLYGPSKYIANYIKKDLNLNQEIRIIETPFEQKNHDADFSLANEITAKTNNNYLLFYGTIGVLKGAKEIADSVYNILSKYQNLYLVLIGKQIPIEDKLPVEIIQKYAKDLANRVIWYDRQPHEKLFPIIKNSLAVLLPSRVDNLPNTCIEAMNLKKIVIGSNGASFEQLIKDGENGFLCEANNAQSIVNAVDKLMSVSNERKSEMEQKAYERTLLLASENIVPQVIDYYDYVIKNWRAA